MPSAQRDHDHDHDHRSHGAGQHHLHAASANLLVAFLLNLGFTLIEIAGGYWTNSIAILSDALHDAGDSFSLGLAWYLQRLSTRSPDPKFTYGYRRLSTLGALITGTVLVAGLAVIIQHAVARLREPVEVQVPGMLVLALIGIAFNGAAAWRLRAGHSLAESLASWHLLEDTLGWVAVLIGSAVMLVWRLPIIDPLLSLGISLFVLWNVVQNLRRVLYVFLQSAPAHFDCDAFQRELAGLPGVVGSHHTHTWTLDGESHVFSTHLVMEPASTREEIVATKRHVHQLLRRQHFAHITIEVELLGEDCAAEC